MRIPVFDDVAMLIIKVGWLTGLMLGVDKRINKITFQSFEPFRTKNLKCVVLDGIVNLVQRRNEVLGLKNKTGLDMITKEDALNTSASKLRSLGCFLFWGCPIEYLSPKGNLLAVERFAKPDFPGYLPVVQPFGDVEAHSVMLSC